MRVKIAFPYKKFTRAWTTRKTVGNIRINACGYSSDLCFAQHSRFIVCESPTEARALADAMAIEEGVYLL